MFVGLAALLALQLVVRSEVVEAGDVFSVALRVPERLRTQLAGDCARSLVLVPQLVRSQSVAGGECLAANVAYAPLKGKNGISFSIFVKLLETQILFYCSKTSIM